MYTNDVSRTVSGLFSELVDGPKGQGNAFILNTGDMGLLRSLDALSPADASQSVNQGATIAAHAQHVRYGLSLMNQWAREGGNPFANAKWDDAWKLSSVDAVKWDEVRAGLRHEVEQWQQVLQSPREVGHLELTGFISSIAHLAYHVGAIRQIGKATRGPREGTF